MLARFEGSVEICCLECEALGEGGGAVWPHTKGAALAPYFSTTRASHAMARTSPESWLSWLHGACRGWCIKCLDGELWPLIGSSLPPAHKGHKGCNSTP